MRWGSGAAVVCALTLAACSTGSAAGTVAEPGWPASPTATGRARGVEVAPTWSVPTGRAPYAGGTVDTGPGWYVVSRTEVSPDGVPQLVWRAGSTAEGSFLGPAVVVEGAVNQPSSYSGEHGPVSLVSVRRSEGTLDLRAYDAASGQVRWSRDAGLGGGGATTFSPAGVVGDLVVGQALGAQPGWSPCAVCALDLETGRTRWAVAGRVPAASDAVGTLAVTPTVVVSALDDQRTLVVLDPRSGRVRAREDGRRPAPPTWVAVRASDRTVVTASGTDEAAAVDVEVHDVDGRVRWRARSLAAPLLEAATDTVLVRTAEEGWTARGGTDGQVRWGLPAAEVAREASAFVAAADARVVGVAAGFATVREASTGELLLVRTLAAANPSAWSGQVYVVADREAIRGYAARRPPVGLALGADTDRPVFLAE